MARCGLTCFAIVVITCAISSCAYESVHLLCCLSASLYALPVHVVGTGRYTNPVTAMAHTIRAVLLARVNRKARRGKRLNCADRSFNRKSNRTRSRVEHAFGVIKHLWGYRKVRYRGLEKNTAQVFTLFALANFYLVRRALAGT